MLRIDGSMGEGGGQVLRTSLALSIATGTPFVIENIRAGRKKPGLLRQHLTAVEAARAISGARVEGDALGSRRVVFSPGTCLRDATETTRHEVAIGSGGSAMLVLQTVLPPLLTAAAPTTVVVTGGTHNPMSPPFEFFDRAFLPWVNRLGPEVHAALDQPGFMVAGGGRVQLHVRPAPKLDGFELLDRGELIRREAVVLISELPPSVGHREVRRLKGALDLTRDECRVVEVEAKGPGNVVLYTLEYEKVTEVFSSFGERGLRSETVADRLISDVHSYLADGAPVGRRLADQLLIPLALAGGGSFRTGPLSLHTETNIDVIKLFLGVEFTIEGNERSKRITVSKQH